jgi:tetratricopeptide (TPR) repeat protein
MNQRRPGAIIHVVLLLSLFLPEQAFAISDIDTDADAAYRAGVQASREGNHAAALQHFRAVRSRGMESPSLIYNLGVTWYQLGNFPAAQREFARLVDLPAWRDMAQYNLGLIAQRQNEDGTARDFFQRVATEAGDTRLQQLALRQLARTKPADPDTSDSMAFFSLTFGHDDNVVAFPEQLQQDSSNASDTFSEALAYGEYYLDGSRNDGIRLKGFGVNRRYTELDTFNSSAVGGGISRQHASDAGLFEWGGNILQTRVNGRTVTTAYQLDISWKYRHHNNDFTLRYRPEIHNAGNAYPQLDGNRHRLDALWRHAFDNAYLRMGLRYETNNRDDLQTASGNRYDYSPTRQQFSISAHWPVRSDWRWSVGAMLGQARYDGENRLPDIDGEIIVARRDSETVEFYLRGNYAISSRWQAFAEVRDERNDDTYQLYSWDRRILEIGIEFTL